MSAASTREADIIGALLLAVVCFAVGVTLGAKVLGKANHKDTMEFLTMSAGWASAIGTFVAAFVALRIALKQNRIATLGEKQRIFRAFFELKMHMTQRAMFADMAEVSKFYHPSIDAKFLLPQDLAKDIADYYDACFWIAEANKANGGTTKESLAGIDKHRAKEKELAPIIDVAISRILQEAQA